MDTVTQVQIFWTGQFAVNIALTYKGMILIILAPVMSKIVGQTGLFNLGMANGLGEGKL